MDLDIEVADTFAHDDKEEDTVPTPKSIQSSSQEEEDVVEDLPEH